RTTSSSLSFFSPRYAAHRHLDSFPTRRSADLTTQTEVPFIHVADAAGASTLPDIVFYVAGGLIGAAGGDIQASSRTLLVDQVERDRKSTRLNSSHVKISYAVFCLKKKNVKTSH